jgi:hypothetical protein
MRKIRASTLVIVGQLALLLACLVFLGITVWHNYFLKLTAKDFAAQAGFMAAARDFAHGRRELYEIQLYKFDIEKDSGTVPTDGTSQPTGRNDGPFQIRALLVNQRYPVVHQEIQKAYVDAYNQHMRQIYDKPQLYDSNGLRLPGAAKPASTN